MIEIVGSFLFYFTNEAFAVMMIHITEIVSWIIYISLYVPINGWWQV